MTTRSMPRAFAFALALLAAACSRPGPAPAPAAPDLAQHGEALTGDASCSGTTVHERHVAQFRCDACHPAGASFGFDVPFTFARGTTTAGGTLTRTLGQPTTCTVACHFPNGAAPRAVAWNTPGPLACTACHDTSRLPPTHAPMPANATRQDCQACHVLTNHTDGVVTASGHAPSWIDPLSPGFHAYAANQGLAACQACHGVNLDGGTSLRSCASCHDANLPAGVTSWTRSCTLCHGGTNDQTGAPPKTIWGASADTTRVGAHAAHVGTASAIAPAFTCAACHVVPTDALSPGHVDTTSGTPLAGVTFSGLASQGTTPTWTRATASCASTYCHGATLAGGSNTAPVWTSVGTGQAACGSCHGLPPPAPHPAATGLGSCVTCHPATMLASGALIPPSSGGKHLDGIVQSTGGHGPAWIDTTSPGFHAFAANQGLAACQACHGVNLDGVGGTATTSCASCHGASWRTTCTTCHGGTNDASGAPPKAIWGSTSTNAVGAHDAHLRAPHGLRPALDCTACHARPADALAAGHADGATQVTGYTGADPVLASKAGPPGWNPTTATCATSYCHGATLAGGTATAPVWTVTDGSQVGCTGCHGWPPRTGKPVGPAGAGYTSHTYHMAVGLGCANCHSGYPLFAVNAGVHIDGRVQVNGNVTSWDPVTKQCVGCHALCRVGGTGPAIVTCTW